MNRRVSVVALFTALALAACSTDVVVSPLRVPTGPKFAVAANPSGNYLVMLNGNGIPKDFALAVAQLGGKITYSHGGAGFATVSGLSADAATQLAGTKGVGDVQEDGEFAFDAPVQTIDADASALFADPSIESQGNPAGAVLATWQWNMKLIGADAAWAVGPNQDLGSSEVRVAILDAAGRDRHRAGAPPTSARAGRPLRGPPAAR